MRTGIQKPLFVFLMTLVANGMILAEEPFIKKDEPTVIPEYTPFERAVLELYELVASTLFYSSDGVNLDAANRLSGPDEKPGVCFDYSMVFIYYWNVIKNYDELFGRAYAAQSGSAEYPDFAIFDIEFTSGSNYDDTFNYHHIINHGTIGKLIYGERYNLLHFGSYHYNHGWPVILHEGEWYDTEPTWWDLHYDYDFLPYKLVLR